jgi:hypothetical protein
MTKKDNTNKQCYSVRTMTVPPEKCRLRIISAPIGGAVNLTRKQAQKIGVKLFKEMSDNPNMYICLMDDSIETTRTV